MSFFFLTPTAAHEDAHPDDVAAALTNDASLTLLDVRSEAEHRTVRLTNSHNIPLEALTQDAMVSVGLGEDAKHKEIYVYCRSGGRSRMACQQLQAMGYTNVKNISGGMLQWEASGHGCITRD